MKFKILQWAGCVCGLNSEHKECTLNFVGRNNKYIFHLLQRILLINEVHENFYLLMSCHHAPVLFKTGSSAVAKLIDFYTYFCKAFARGENVCQCCVKQK
jgi:hypothetical protein